MKRKFIIEYLEKDINWKTYRSDNFVLYEDIYQRLTVRDVKEYVKEQRYKKHEPVCTCLLEVWDCNKALNVLSIMHTDSTFLDNTIFNESNYIWVIQRKEKKCECGQLEKLIISSNFEKQREEDNKRWNEKEKRDREYYERRLDEEKRYHQNEINRLQNMINQQNRDSQKQIRIQNQQHQKEITRMQQENNRRENDFLEERRVNKEKFQSIENQRLQERRENAERLKIIENERNREREENKKKFSNIEQERNREREENKKKFSNIEKERNRERESYSQRFNTLEKTLKEKDEQLIKNTKKLEENENQKKLLAKNEKDAENEFNSQNQEICNKYFENNKVYVSLEMGKKIKNFIDEKISLESIDEDFIFKIVKGEKFPKIVKEFMDDKIINLNNESMNINISTFNIIILGNTGVGKSTLLNTVLKEKLAKTDFGDACTMGVPKPYESEKAKGIRIWDSRGIENGKYNLEITFNDVKNTIESLIKENNPDKFIHCIWYCIRSNRFTEEEADNLKNCYHSYIEKLPIIVVFTQSENQKETDKMIEKVKIKLEKTKKLNGYDEKRCNDIKITKVLAEDYEHDFGTVKSFGIHNLMEQTYENAKIGIERACTHSLMEKGQEIIKVEFKEIIRKIKEKIFGNKNEVKENEETNKIVNQPNNVLDNILNEEKERKNNINVKSITNFDFHNYRNFCKIFSREIVKNLLLKESISYETISSIDKVIECESEKIHQYLEQIFQSQLDIICNKLTEELVDFVAKLENKFQISNLSSKYHYNELKRQAKNEIIKNFKPVIEDIIYREISQLFFQKFSEKISSELSKCFHELLKNNKKIREIFSEKGKENSLICLNKIKNLMNYPSDDYDERNPKKKKNAKKSTYEDLNEEEEEE